jgi:glycerophosphoryl diester phosphodiesterase
MKPLYHKGIILNLTALGFGGLLKNFTEEFKTLLSYKSMITSMITLSIKENAMKKGLKIFLIIIIILIAVFVILQIVPRNKPIKNNPWMIEDGERPFVIVHGGAKVLFPENTVLAFEEITKLNIDVLEIDLALTKDEILITHHDLTIDRMTDGSGSVIDYTLDELMGFDFAYKFKGLNNDFPYKGNKKAKPETMENLFKKYPDFMYVIELKDMGETGKKASENLYELVKKYNMHNKVIIASFDDDTIQHFHKISDGQLMLSTPQGDATRFVILEKLRLGALYFSDSVALQLPVSEKAMGINLNLSTESLIKEAHKHNMAVHYWTINHVEEMELLVNRGADGIITDRPDLLIDLLNEMGY